MVSYHHPLRRASILAALLLSIACQKVILHDLPEAEANAALLALKEAGVSARKSRGRAGYQVEVPEAEEAFALRVLKEARLPRPQAPSFETDSLFPSPQAEAEAQRARRAFAIAQDLEAIDGILEARVTLAPPPRPSLWEEREQPIPAAAVLYRYRKDAQIPEESVRALVCAALGEISCQRIEVLAVPVEPPEAKSPFTYVGPFAVAPESARGLLLALGGCLLLLLSAGCFSAFALLRKRRLSLQEEPHKDAAPPEEEPAPEMP